MNERRSKMNETIDKKETPYFEPLLIYLGDETWVHPRIEDYVDINPTEEFPADYNVHRFIVEFKDDPTHCDVIVKSSAVDKVWEEEKHGEKEFQEIMCLLETVLLVSRNTDAVEQFCLTEFGTKLRNKFKKGWRAGFSPDCCVHKDEDIGYTFST